MKALPPGSRVGIVAKSHLKQASPYLAEIAAWLEARGIVPVFETATAALIPPTHCPVADKRARVDQGQVVLVLGGGGTLLGLADPPGEAQAGIPTPGLDSGPP